MESSAKNTIVHTGYKVAKVRWKPMPPGSIGKSNTLAMGSYEDQENRVALWTLPEEEGSEDISDGGDDGLVPRLTCDLALPAGVTDMCFVGEHFLVVSMEDGSVRMLKYLEAAKTLREAVVWEGLHHMPTGRAAPCTALSVVGGDGVVAPGGDADVVTGGEDGRIAVLRSSDTRPVMMIDGADSGTVTGLLCSRQLEVLSTSSCGQLKVWDLRESQDRPVSYVLVPGEFTSMESLARHPHQPHVLAIGRGDGSLCFKDLRQPRQSLQLLQAHSAEVWEVKFDGIHPNNLFSCSQDGSLWHWDVNDIASKPTASRLRQPNPSLLATPYERSLTTSRLAGSSFNPSHLSAMMDYSAASLSLLKTSELTRNTSSGGGLSDSTHATPTSCPWLSDAVQRGKVSIKDFSPGQELSVNSLDVESQRLVCGTDGETLILVPPLSLR